MPRATSSSSSTASSSSSAHRARKRYEPPPLPPPRARRPHTALSRHLTREQLLKSLQLLGEVSAPLPAELPPSPPASREPSPALGLKRRHDADPASSSSKRQRTSSVSSSSRPPLPSRPVPVPAASTSRHEPAEDGEVREDSAPASTFTPVSLPASFPVRRPRRGNTMPASEWDAIYEKCFANARKLKYSAYARVAAAHPQTSKDYKALRVPPAPGSGYAQHSLLMARLELIDSLLHFIYGLWCGEFSVRTCYRGSWRTVDDAFSKTEAKWHAESTDEREKAFVGLIHLMYAFIHGRKLRYKMGSVDRLNDEKIQRLHIEWSQAKAKKAAQAQAQAAEPSPRMLPSPAASSTSSSNSTPLGGHGTAAAANSALFATPAQPPLSLRPVPNDIKHPVNWAYVWENKAQTSGLRVAMDRIGNSQTTLNLPVLFKHFPRTFARMINTSLSPQDEHEPDFQDDECELYWPGQVITGEGLGWVCLMGMSMVKEFGRDYGYEGLNGVVQRASGDPDLGYNEPRLVKDPPLPQHPQ
ncbi:hypothetical protein K466DRAFT_595582 [Polyporus arcularius HHB13444]|uniref:Uncharacterized protein n=1 Tax=Polyporus arcularius HHB13444 TaxID=1314778 RepID=A0A5C3PQZ4_9APHY|nr:hypothetical protein K466DRAFT_595582 [Polyporus arcularius HHB13444]